MLAILTVVCGCLFVGCADRNDTYGDYTLQGFTYSVTGVGEGYVDIYDMSEDDHATYDSVIVMYGKRVHITSKTIRFVDGMVLSGYGDTEYTLDGENVTFSDRAIASTFNNVQLANGVFSIGVSQTVEGTTVKYSFEYYSEKATVPTYKVWFNSTAWFDSRPWLDSDVTPVDDHQIVKKGGKVQKPSDPQQTGYVFCGWYTNLDFDDAYDFSAQVLRSFTLYAKWEPLPTAPVGRVGSATK